MSSTSTTGSIASIFTTTMFVMALSCTAEAFMVRSLTSANERTGRRTTAAAIPSASLEAVSSEPSPIGMTIFVYGDHNVGEAVGLEKEHNEFPSPCSSPGTTVASQY